MKLENLSPDNVDLVKSLQELGISDEEIIKSLNLPTEKAAGTEKKIEKSIDEQISEAQANLDKLNQLKDINKSDNIEDLSPKFDEIKKSFSDQIQESAEKADSRFEGLTDLMKSLTDTVSSYKEDLTSIREENTKLTENNSDLKKSLDESSKILNKLANYSPGLRSLTGAKGVERFEKSTTGEDILSKSVNKNVIMSKLTKKLDEPEFQKSLGGDVANYEISGVMSAKLEKAVKDELSIAVVE